jgi:hypothetical protein
VFTGFLAMTMSAMACVFAAGFFVGHWTIGPWARIPATLFVAFLLTFTWRLNRTALVISDNGVRARWLLKTRTMRWQEINGFLRCPEFLGGRDVWVRRLGEC